MAEANSQSGWEFKYWIFPAYLRAFRPKRKPRKRRPTERGQVVITGAVLTAALGLNTETSFVYQIFALLLCLAIASRFGLRLSKPSLRVHRVLPRYATAGEKFTYRIRLENLSEQLEADLTVTDVPKNKLPTLEQYRSEFEPDEQYRNAYDRFIGFHRFIYLQRQNTGIQMTPSHVDEIPRQGFTEVEIEASALRRGKVDFSHTLVLHQDPLALNYGFNQFDNPESMIILPRRYHLGPNWQFSGGRSFQQGGITSSWSTGESDEFVSLRDYRDGDSMRKIHWPSSAKQIAKKQGLVVKEYQDEYFARNALILDIHRGSRDTIEKTISVAATFVLEQQADSILDLVFLDASGPRILTADASNLNGNEQLEALAMMQPGPDDLDQLLEASLMHINKVTGAICLFSSWQPQHEEMIRKLSAQGKELHCLVLTEQNESGPFTRIRPSAVQEDLLTI